MGVAHLNVVVYKVILPPHTFIILKQLNKKLDIMSRYTGPTTRINRRFSQAIFAPTKAFERKPHLPGQHGPRLRRKLK